MNTLIKVVPGKNYLRELRDCAKGQLSNEKYSNELVIEYFKRNAGCEEIKTLSYKKTVSSENVKDFLYMTPMMFHVNKNKLGTQNIENITFDFTILISKIK